MIRTAHRMGMETVAVYSDADAKALHVREATHAVALGGNASADTYLRIDKLIAAAQASGADAVHPGYGFLSENADFAQAVIDAGLVWVGPPPQAIRTLGNKSLGPPARAGARRALPAGLPGRRPVRRAFRRGGAAHRLSGDGQGGGRWRRARHAPGDRAVAVAGGAGTARARKRSRRSAPANCCWSARCCAPRHVEVQVFADAHGHCIHLGERDCSVQRRHQKIIEETPSPAVDAALRERMGRCAVELAQAAGYVGAGTVEFLLDESPKRQPRTRGRDAFFMMEMNTRLQVEHPVTEAVTGLDLVEWQLRVAQGEPLPLTQEQVRFEGHAIEVRLCAEDEHFTPHTGTVRHFRSPGEGRGEALRFDHALFEGLRGLRRTTTPCSAS